MSCNAAVLLLMTLLSSPAFGAAEEISLDLRTPLCIAVEEEKLATVEALVNGSADVNEACAFTKSDYPFLIAARTGNVDIGKLLLSKGADVNQVGFLGYTPLLRAGEGLHPQFVQLLLEKNANVNAKLIELAGLDANLGLDVLSLTTASYLRLSLIASTAGQNAMDRDYAAVLELLFKYCFDFKQFGDTSVTRLKSESHPAEAAHVSALMKKEPPSCWSTESSA